MIVERLADMASNQNAPSAKDADSDWLMGISTKSTSNHQTPPSAKDRCLYIYHHHGTTSSIHHFHIEVLLQAKRIRQKQYSFDLKI
jgi:hypothetical protein